MKPPLMPRHIAALEEYLVLDHPSVVLGDVPTLGLKLAAALVCLAFYFGWRDDTAS